MNLIVNSVKKTLLSLISPRYRESQRVIRILQRSKFFDGDWYLSEYPDVKLAGVQPEAHYANSGFIEGRIPGPLFDDDYYLSQIREYATDDIPLIHYERTGKLKGLLPFRNWEQHIWWKNLKPARYAVGSNSKQPPEIRRKVSIIVPIFNGAEFVEKCLLSLTQLQGDYQVIMIDDGSKDPGIHPLLSNYSKLQRFALLINTKNLGFTKSVNKGISASNGLDIILLNSDTIVPPTLVRNLQATAYTSAEIGTVTPLSNEAGPFSIPKTSKMDGTIYSYDDVVNWSRAFSQASVATPVEVPTGHGFCIFIKANLIAKIGKLDSTGFPRGYGEENDFCFRAKAAGWYNVVDCKTFVYHNGAMSFQNEKKQLLEHGIKLLNNRYPNYNKQIQDGFSTKSFISMKRQIVIFTKRWKSVSKKVKPRILFFIATESGGTAKTNIDLMSALQDKYETFILKSNSRRVSLHHFEPGGETTLETSYLAQPLKPFPHSSAEYDDVVQGWLETWFIELMHVRQIACHSISIVKKAKEIGIPTVYSFHDFYSVCPSVKLLDESFRFCGGRCTKGDGICQTELWSPTILTHLKHKRIVEWQKQFSELLTYPDAFVTTSVNSKEVIDSVYKKNKNLNIQIIPHGRDFSGFEQLAKVPETHKALKLLTLGTITKSKGAEHLKHILDNFLDVEIHVVGEIKELELIHPRLKVHGKYRRDEISSIIRNIGPSWGLVLSIWPETWCHTLTELWSCGIPTLSFNIGAIGERVEKNDCGLLAADMSSNALNDLIHEASDSEVWQEFTDNVENWQKSEGLAQSTHHMASFYSQIYENILKPKINIEAEYS